MLRCILKLFRHDILHNLSGRKATVPFKYIYQVDIALRSKYYEINDSVKLTKTASMNKLMSLSFKALSSREFTFSLSFSPLLAGAGKEMSSIWADN
jgi:hypothetical protein